MPTQTFKFAAVIVVKAPDALTAFQYIQQHNEMLPDVVIHIKKKSREQRERRAEAASVVPFISPVPRRRASGDIRKSV